MSRDSVSMLKLKGQKWKTFADTVNKWSNAESDDEDVPISELSSEHRKQGKGHGLQQSRGKPGTAGTGRSSIHSRQRGSVMRLDKADMGLYGLCPETDAFYAVVCDICSSVVKPQGLQKHMSNRHHSYYNHATKSLSSSHSSSNSSREHYGGAVGDFVRSGTGELVRAEKVNCYAGTHGNNNSSNQAGNASASSSKYDELDTGAQKIRTSGSKVKNKSAKSGSSSHSSSSAFHNGKSFGNNGSSSLSSTGSKASAMAAAQEQAVAVSDSAAVAGRESSKYEYSSASGLEKKSSFSSTSSSANSESGGPAAALTASPSGKSSGKRGNAKQATALLSSSSSFSSSSCSSTSSNSSSSSSSSNSNSSNSSAASVGPTVKSLERKSDRREYDPDRHCGVSTSDGKRQCTRPINCKSHSLTQRRIVPGRSKNFDKLLSEYKSTGPGAGTKDDNFHEVESSSNSSCGFDVDRRSMVATGSTGGENSLPSTAESGSKASVRSLNYLSDMGKGSAGGLATASPLHKLETKGERSKHKSRSHLTASSQSQSTKASTAQRSSKLQQQQLQQLHQLQQQQLDQQQQQIMLPGTAEIIAQHFTEENPNTVLTDATLVMDPNTNLLKLSVSGALHPGDDGEVPDQSMQQFTTNLMQDQLTVTVPLSVISSMNISGTNLVNVSTAGDVGGSMPNGTTTVMNAMPAGSLLAASDGTGMPRTESFIAAELIDQLPLVQGGGGTELHDPNQYIATDAGQEMTEHTLSDLQIPAYNHQINYTLQTLAQDLQNEQMQEQADLVESIDDIMPTINLLPTAANPLGLPQMQADLSDSIILTPNQLTSLSQSLVDQHFIDNVALKPEMELLTVNTAVDVSKLMLLKKVDDEFLKERQQQQQSNLLLSAQLDDFRGVKMWYNFLPKPLHVNNFQLHKLGGGSVMSRKLLTIRRNLVSESQALAKSLNSQLSPISPRNVLGFGAPGGRSAGDLLSPLAGMGKDLNGGGLGSLSGASGAANRAPVNRGQRRLIVPPQAAVKKSNEKTSCLLSNAYFKNLINSMQQQNHTHHHQHHHSHGHGHHRHHTNSQQHSNSSNIGNNHLHQQSSPNAVAVGDAGDALHRTLKRPSSALMSLSSKRLKIINNLQNSTAPPQLLLQGSGKVKPKVL